MAFSQNPSTMCVANTCYLLVIGPLLLALCDIGNTDYKDDQDKDPSDYTRAQYSDGHAVNGVRKFSSPSDNGEENNKLRKHGEKFTYNNATPNSSINENISGAGNNGSDVDYDYDYDESHNIFNWSELIPTLVIYGATMVIGIAGNSLIIFTICRYRRMKSTTNVFLASLASADLRLIIICIPVKVRQQTFVLFSCLYGTE